MATNPSKFSTDITKMKQCCARVAAAAYPSPLFETILFAFEEEIRLGGSQIDNLGTAVSVLGQLNTLAAIISITVQRGRGRA